MFEKQIDICPDDLWNKKVGGYIFWQQHIHILACTLLYARPDKPFFDGLPYKPEVIMLSGVPDFRLRKEDIRKLAEESKNAAHEFINNQTVASLTAKHQLLAVRLPPRPL